MFKSRRRRQAEGDADQLGKEQNRKIETAAAGLVNPELVHLQVKLAHWAGRDHQGGSGAFCSFEDVFNITQSLPGGSRRPGPAAAVHLRRKGNGHGSQGFN